MLVKLKNCRLRWNLMFDLSKLGQILTKHQNRSHYQSWVLAESNPQVFFAMLYDSWFRNARDVISTPPPPPFPTWVRYKKGRARVRVKTSASMILNAATPLTLILFWSSQRKQIESTVPFGTIGLLLKLSSATVKEYPVYFSWQHHWP